MPYLLPPTSYVLEKELKVRMMMREIMGRDQTSRAISSARLKWLPTVHLRPINLVVSQGP